MKSIIVLVFLVALVATPVFGQVVGIPGMGGVNAERYGRQAYAPFDRIIGAVGTGGYYDGGGYYGGGFGGGRATAIIGGVAAGAGVGYAIGGNSRSAMIGAGIGGGVLGIAEYAMNRATRGSKNLDCGKRKLSKKEDAACKNELAAMQAQAEMAERKALGKKLFNSTRWPVQVLDCGQPVGQLRPRSSAPALEARCGYSGVILAPDPTNPGRTQRYEAAFRLTDDQASGWVFRAPTEMGGGQ
ncbi:MAG: hypothetical protein AAB784_00710 [Patescibacteria group bacterium]